MSTTRRFVTIVRHTGYLTVSTNPFAGTQEAAGRSRLIRATSSEVAVSRAAQSYASDDEDIEIRPVPEPDDVSEEVRATFGGTGQAPASATRPRE